MSASVAAPRSLSSGMRAWFLIDTGAAAWAWLLVYIAVPVALPVAIVIQMRAPGGDPMRRATLPTGLRAALGFQAAAMLLAGIILTLAPTAGFWPWALTPLTGRIVGAWLIGTGVAAGQAVWENAYERLQPFFIGLTFIGALECIALARYAGAVDWSGAGWVYLILVLSQLCVGAYGWWTASHQPRVLG